MAIFERRDSKLSATGSVASHLRRSSLGSVMSGHNNESKRDKQLEMKLDAEALSLKQLLPGSTLRRTKNNGIQQDSISRVLFAAAHSTTDGQNLSDFIEGVLTEICPQGDMGGLCVIQRSSALVLIETESSALLKILAALQDAINLEESPLSNIRVIANSEDVAEQLFISWEWRQITLPKESHLDLSGDTLTDAVSDINIGLLKIAKTVESEREFGGPMAVKETLDAMAQRFPKLIPSNERVLYCTENKELIGLSSFLEMYAAPMECTSCADEDVWPGNNVLDSLRWLAPLMP